MYSRRQFLQVMGIAVAGSQILSLPLSLTADEAIRGRALYALPLYRRPQQHAEIVNRLWPDSITAIYEADANWYRVSGGYVQRDGLQPMAAFNPLWNIRLPHQAYWAEVTAPVAAVREHCAADAPLVTRIGHGGVTQVVDYLPGDWYGLADETGNWLGWSQATRWQPADVETFSHGNHSLEINLQTQTLTAWDDGELVLTAPCSTDPALRPGQYSFSEQKPGSAKWDTESRNLHYHGLPWLNYFGDEQLLAGVYWHNQFGQPTPGAAVQVTPLLARWLYGWLNGGSSLYVI